MIADEWAIIAPAVLISIIDRGGLPMAMCVALGALPTQSPFQLPLVMLCALAGAFGDILYFEVARRLPRGKTSPFRAKSILVQVEKLGARLRGSLLLWFCVGRVFASSNQLFPILAGWQGISPWVIWPLSLMANFIYFTLTASLALYFMAQLEGYSRPIQIISALLGIVIPLIFIDRSLSPSHTDLPNETP